MDDLRILSSTKTEILLSNAVREFVALRRSESFILFNQNTPLLAIYDQFPSETPDFVETFDQNSDAFAVGK